MKNNEAEPTPEVDPVERMRQMIEEQADEALSQNDLANYDFLVDQLNRLPKEDETTNTD